jgi:hypothetical protein
MSPARAAQNFDGKSDGGFTAVISAAEFTVKSIFAAQ